MEYVKTGTVSDTTPPPPPCDVETTPKGGMGMEVAWKAYADFEGGVRNFIVLCDGEELVQVLEKPVGQIACRCFN
jgi:hypothetical protein